MGDRLLNLEIHCNRPRLVCVVSACPAKRGVGFPIWYVPSESVSESRSRPGSDSPLETDYDADPDPDADRTVRDNGTPERPGLSGLHGQKPSVYLALSISLVFGLPCRLYLPLDPGLIPWNFEVE